ncbi:hypothetical protein RB653_002470 [Dictyostelium firmibasis]|uniref:Uncharacterized protein n=1 Tax=Dictyostelium firmibasis TaxID=79012 RepID=A0AAN7TWH5_9MYCE
MAFGTQKESSSIFNKHSNSDKQQQQKQQDNNKNNLSNLSASSFFYQINNHIHSFATQFYWKENLDSPHYREEGSKRCYSPLNNSMILVMDHQQKNTWLY